MEQIERISGKQASRDIMRLFLPCLVELFLGQLAGMIDTMMVSGIGTAALNAVGICGNPILLLTMIFTALNVGTTALISRAKGEGDIHKANEIARQAIVINLIVGVLMMIAGFFLIEPMIAMMGTPNAETAVLAADYMRYRIVAMPFLAVGTANNAILRGMGNTRAPMLYNLVANAVNVLFNWLLINGIWFFPQMGVSGAALATTICNITGTAIGCVLLLRGISDIKLNFKEKFSFDRALLWNISIIGMPSMGEQVVFRLGHILFSRLTISLGATDYAAHQIVWNILNLIMLLGSAMQMAVAPLTGQCLGREDVKRAEDYHKYSIWILLISMILSALICLFFGRQLLMLYSPEADVLTAALPVLRVVAATLPIMAFQYVYGGALAGAGDTKFNAPIFMVTVIAVRLPLAFVAKEVLGWGLMGINLATLIDVLLRHVLFYARYKTGKWKSVKLK